MADELSRGPSNSSSDFEFSSTWQLEAPRESVWEALMDFESWPAWWPGLEELVPTRAGDASGVGQVARSRWRGPIGYQFTFTVEAVELVPHEFLKGEAQGDLTGHGCWYLSQDGGWTGVRLDWVVKATKGWMEFLAPVARPVFVYGHDYVMEKGAEGLAGHLGVDMRDFRSTS
jgi:carbon monoxide dehydrogenase subunit G